MQTNRIARGQLFMIIVLIFSVLALAVDARPAAADIGSNFVIHALSTSSDAIVIGGSANLNIFSGSIYSNGGVIKNGSSGSINLQDGDLLIAMDNGWSGAGLVSPAPRYTDLDGHDLTPIPATMPLGDPCAGANRYPSTSFTGKVDLLPRIYCIVGDINLSGSDVLTGDGVMLVMLNGGIKLSGNARIDLRSGPDLVDNYGNNWGGMLIYLPTTNQSDIVIGGDASLFSGTILAPQSSCYLSGPIASITSKIICNKVKIQGQEEIRLASY